MPLTLLRHARQKPPAGPLEIASTIPLSSGLVFASPLADYGSATPFDPALAVAGSLVGGGPAWSSGQLGGQLTFTSASHQALDFGAADTARSTSAVSISAWVVNSGAASERVIIGWNQATAAGYFLEIDASQNLELFSRAVWNIADTATVPTGALTHVGVTFNGQTNPNTVTTFYINGLRSSASASQVATLGTYSTADSLRIGSESNFRWYDGSIAAVFMWTRALSDAEMASLYTEPFALFQSRSLQRWFVVPIQIARPTSDTSLGGWTTETGGTTSEYSHINEVVRDDTNYVQSSLTPTNDAVTFALGTLLTPASGTQTLRYRYSKQAIGMQINLQVDLLQSGIIVQTWTHTDISSTFTEATQNVTGVTDYTAPLSITFTATQP